MNTIFAILLELLKNRFRSRSDLEVEIVALRQQVATLKAKNARPQIKMVDRLFWVQLSRFWPSWRRAPLIVQPETVVRWHRKGFRLYWRWKSKPKGGRPRVPQEVRDLIKRMASENPTWGAPRIHGELLMLGFDIAERSISRYLPKTPPSDRTLENWRTFLQNHREVIAAMDFFTVPSATFKQLYGYFIIHHGKRKIQFFNATENPTAEWVIQQLRNAFPKDTAPRYLIFDNDAIFSPEVVAAMKEMGIEPKRTGLHSPWQNGTAERWIRSCRQELLDHVVPVSSSHLTRLVTEYRKYYHDRTNLGLAKNTPSTRQPTSKTLHNAKVISLPGVGGLHHRYDFAQASQDKSSR